MATQTLPTGGIQSISWNTDYAMEMIQGKWSLKPYITVQAGDARLGILHVRDLKNDDAAEWQAFHKYCVRRTEKIWVGPKQITTSISETPLVNGADQTGYQLITDGWTPSYSAPRGLWFMVQSDTHFYQFAAAGTADGSGNMTIDLDVNIRNSPSNNASIVFSDPKSEFYIASKTISWEEDHNYNMTGLSIAIIEAIP